MIYKSVGTFRVFSSSSSLADIEGTLGTKSSGGYSKGDPISKKNPNSKLQAESLWTIDEQLASEAEQDASELMDKTLAALLSKVEILLPRVTEIADVSCDIHTGMFSDNEQINSYLSKSTLARLASTELDVLFSGYTKL